jgi:hypothetical protein
VSNAGAGAFVAKERPASLQFHGWAVLSQLAYQVISLTGAILVLAGYTGLQRGWLAREDRLFNLLNLVGSGLLAWIAIVDRRWGFILLEVLWAVLSIPPLVTGSHKTQGDHR